MRLQFIPDQYEKQEILGTGAYGVVYKCFDDKQNRVFVAKEIVWHLDKVCLNVVLFLNNEVHGAK